MLNDVRIRVVSHHRTSIGSGLFRKLEKKSSLEVAPTNQEQFNNERDVSNASW